MENDKIDKLIDAYEYFVSTQAARHSVYLAQHEQLEASQRLINSKLDQLLHIISSQNRSIK